MHRLEFWKCFDEALKLISVVMAGEMAQVVKHRFSIWGPLGAIFNTT